MNPVLSNVKFLCSNKEHKNNLKIYDDKSREPHITFLYYGKKIILPYRGDIVTVITVGFSMYYLLIVDVKQGSYNSVILKQKDVDVGICIIQDYITARFRDSYPRRVVLDNPKDRRKFIRLEITPW